MLANLKIDLEMKEPHTKIWEPDTSEFKLEFCYLVNVGTFSTIVSIFLKFFYLVIICTQCNMPTQICQQVLINL